METVVSVTSSHVTKIIKDAKYVCTFGNSRGVTVEVLDFVRNESSLQEMVVYKVLSGNNKGKKYVCSFSMFVTRHLLKEEEEYGT